MINHACRNDYTWNPRIFTCEQDEKCEIDQILNNITCLKQSLDNLVILYTDEPLNNTTFNTNPSKRYLILISY